MALSHSAATPALETPFDYQAALDNSGWRETVAWPLPYRETFRVTRAATGAALATIDGVEDAALRAAALLGLGPVLALSRSLIENAFVLQAADTSGMRLVGGPPELAALGGEA